MKLAHPFDSELASRYALPAALGLGALARLGHLLALRQSALFDVLQWDAKTYDDWARTIADGQLIGARAFWQDPLYAYVLGGLYRLFGYNLWLPRLLGLACGVCTAWLAARIAKRLFATRVAEVGAALLFGLYLPAIHYEAIVGKTALAVLLLTLVAELFLRGSERALGWCGLALGLGVLTRGNLLVLLPLALFALWLDWSKPRARRRDRRTRARRAGRLLAGALPIIALATLHNFLAVHELVPITTNLGINLYLGNHAGNEHGYYAAPPFLPANADTEMPSFREEAERRGGEPLSDYQLSRYWTRETLRVVLAEPGRVLALVVDKLLLLCDGDEVSDADSIDVAAEYSPVLRLPFVKWGQLLPFAVLGAIVHFRTRRVRALALLTLAYALSLLPFFMLGRLRVPMAPALAVLAMAGAVWLARALRERDRPRLTRAALLLAPCLLLAFYRPAWMQKSQLAALAINWNDIGAALAERGDQEGALHAYDRAVALDARSVPVALRQLAALREQRGELAGALRALDQLVELKPESGSAQAALRRVRSKLLAAPTPPASVPGEAPQPAPPSDGVPATSDGAAAPGVDWSLAASARDALVARLASEPAGSRVYLRFDGRDASARELAKALAAAYAGAGWQVAEYAEADVALRPGLFLFAAREPTAAYTATQEALERAGFTLHAGTGYADFVADKRRQDPGYRGLGFAPGQDFVLAVGRRP